uniref:HMG box domain-containing protein n=1 Tax=Aplanochytrium stocchinoi TaxID=215587 RepID=A0A7S3V0Z0_9STRA|mmetsp:Transcript_11088/g.13855  ORF Transcript_11088/g.13855 Transcript_11088/m.13855 type:complete len:111 (-) Transcript_11088:1830-2162(-)|eukprot:CAMPEP_0204857012 /NCGR_PEP_ID=MMETSP1347-20130617/19849_1 /ASSEMBLY_ACC=CAM_ASM_000690 /TAXON_ID=215587 /ORGANISM="Aplanochytrium stocchinoi, Strain GSBS06" /LENGTH=110 /DNA_ID=CAMNT_0052004129 /DNA_START=134 /DNA_END=466 /DNA_ORIENTATION=+
MAKAGRRRKKKDPDAPKRAMCAYMFYSNKRRPQLKKSRPGLPFGEYAKIIAEEWKIMSDHEKSSFVELAKKDKIRYERQLKAYELKKETVKPPKPPVYTYKYLNAGIGDL